MDQIEINREAGICRLTSDEVTMLLDAISEASESLEGWEYSTRMGFAREEVGELRQSLQEMLRSIESPSG